MSRFMKCLPVVVLLSILMGVAWSQGPPRSALAHQDVLYGTAGGERLLLDVYDAGRSRSARPALVLVHGGAFRAGDKAMYAPLASALARMGYVAFSVNYRLAPRHTYPAALDDVQRAVRWIRAHAARFGVDPARVGALGHSAGGYFAAMLAVRDTRDNSIPDLRAWSSRVTCACDFFGLGDLQGDLGDGQGVQIVADFLGRSREEAPALWREASPVAHVSKKSAPLYIFHGTRDRNVPRAQSVLLEAALRKAGAPVEFMTLEGAGHGWPPQSEYGRRSEPAMLAFLRKHLRP